MSFNVSIPAPQGSREVGKRGHGAEFSAPCHGFGPATGGLGSVGEKTTGRTVKFLQVPCLRLENSDHLPIDLLEVFRTVPRTRAGALSSDGQRDVRVRETHRRENLFGSGPTGPEPDIKVEWALGLGRGRREDGVDFVKLADLVLHSAGYLVLDRLTCGRVGDRGPACPPDPGSLAVDDEKMDLVTLRLDWCDWLRHLRKKWRHRWLVGGF